MEKFGVSIFSLGRWVSMEGDLKHRKGKAKEYPRPLALKLTSRMDWVEYLTGLDPKKLPDTKLLVLS